MLVKAPAAAHPLWTDPQRSAWKRPGRLTVSQWADQHRVLDSLLSSEPGPWVTNRVPHAREWMDNATTPWVRQTTIVASTQVAKTETLNNVMGYFVHHDPSPIVLVLPRDVDVTTAFQRRLQPLVRSSAALTAETSSRLHDAKRREFAFRRSTIYLRSSQSPTDMASVAARVLLGDEANKWPRWAGREANPWDLARERTRTFWNRVLYLVSTPTIPGGLITTEFEDGDRRRYHVPCPHCRRHQVLKWGLVKWPNDITNIKEMRARREAWYQCAHCDAKIGDHHKQPMLSAGIWVPEGHSALDWLNSGASKDRADHRSYHIWAAYSPWISWWEIVAEHLRSAGHPERLQNFYNSWLAEIWEDRVDATTDEDVEACRSDYQMGIVPAGVVVLTASVDVQKRYLVWSVEGWGYDGESWVIAAGRAETFADLHSALFENTWGEEQLTIRLCVIDSRTRRDEVLEFALSHRPVVRMIQGIGGRTPVPFTVRRIDKHPRTGEVLKESQQVWSVVVDIFKDELAARVARRGEPTADSRAVLHLPADLPKEFATQLASEQKVAARSGNSVKESWVKKPGVDRNEFWDLCVYNLAAARMIRIGALRSRPVAPIKRRMQPEPPQTSRPSGRGRSHRDDLPRFPSSLA